MHSCPSMPPSRLGTARRQGPNGVCRTGQAMRSAAEGPTKSPSRRAHGAGSSTNAWSFGPVHRPFPGGGKGTGRRLNSLAMALQLTPCLLKLRALAPQASPLASTESRDTILGLQTSAPCISLLTLGGTVSSMYHVLDSDRDHRTLETVGRLPAGGEDRRRETQRSRNSSRSVQSRHHPNRWWKPLQPWRWR